MQTITTRSGVAYEGPSNLTKPSPKKVVERETEEIMDEEQNNFQGSTAQIPPPVIPKPISEPEIPKTLQKSTPIPEPEIPKTVILKTGHTLIDILQGEITLHVDNEAVTFNLDQTMKYSSTNDKSVNRIDIINEICEEYVPELLGFPSDDFSSGNPTSTSEPFTSEFLYDKSISLESDHDDCDPEEDIYVLEQLLNDDPFQLPPMDLKQSEVTEAKSSIEEPPELELKDLPSHLEYAFLEENDKLPVIIAKGLKTIKKKLSLISDNVRRSPFQTRRFRLSWDKDAYAKLQSLFIPTTLALVEIPLHVNKQRFQAEGFIDREIRSEQGVDAGGGVGVGSRRFGDMLIDLLKGRLSTRAVQALASRQTKAEVGGGGEAQSKGELDLLRQEAIMLSFAVNNQLLYSVFHQKAHFFRDE
ncbi:hypothetical protein Tco_0544219 [Tanacetum coccineum]